MHKTKVVVLGASGMLGAAVFRSFVASDRLEVIATVRDRTASRLLSAPQARFVSLDVLDEDAIVSLLDRERPEAVVNCIGLVKQLTSASDPLVALPINAIFPHRLVRLCALIGARLIHISTDCVFSGSKGNYTEDDVTDAHDVYGRSKLLGELLHYENAVTLRTSIIGRELYTAHSLLEWFLSQQGSVNGYAEAIFSGLPTPELANVIRDVVLPKNELAGLYHVSAAPISKFDLLHLLARQYGKAIDIRKDVTLKIDRSLNSEKFSKATGYRAAGWPELIQHLYEADLRREMKSV
ncbi:dTDP-4-dehydrorhamnose reductase family protein [Bradyrhizobium iriomotense]|uniref:dTDP-4-dehydrorhamnose reductase n=1 Tax=Bradyrhizobium iriomotense TaxID=441950 RepID=A0ABQ6B033_9BRAD|nr:SDR family oxidoreductase [Bradyrhizobium iriomotense]GLR87680.1 NAD(P)-dependent oxidoreductase [Bradyrhizobium iriomotense]